MDKDANQFDPNHARFQRTDQWMPVYSWLESLDTDELIKSKDILDWLSENPEVREQLYSRHSRYHLMHYIKKCHVKILKRKEKKKGLKSTNKTNSVQVQKLGPQNYQYRFHEVILKKRRELKSLFMKESNHRTGTTLNNLPKDSDIYIAKRNEAYHKYEILVELEKQLSTLFPKRENLNNLKES